jgi:alanyl aminopeptidase
MRGVKSYLEAHRHGHATADDFLAAVSAEAGTDVATPFRTFLDRPGLPLLDVSVACGPDRVTLRQSRYVGAGATASHEGSWRLPACLRLRTGAKVEDKCVLVEGPELVVDLPGACSGALFPNADGAGYYRFRLSDALLAKVPAEVAALDVREQLALAGSLVAGVRDGVVPAGPALGVLRALARSPDRHVALAPGDLLTELWEHVVTEARRDAFSAYVRATWAHLLPRLSLAPATGLRDEEKLLRSGAQRVLVKVGREPSLVADAALRGRALVGFGGDGAYHPEAVDADAAELVLGEALQQGDAALFDHVVKLLAATTAPDRRRVLIAGLASTTGSLAAKVRELVLGDTFRSSELRYVLWPQASRWQTREATWAWTQEHLDALIAKLGHEQAGELPWLAAGRCTTDAARELETVFGPRAEKMEGGPRAVAEAAESLRLCAARRAIVAPQLDAALASP